MAEVGKIGQKLDEFWLKFAILGKCWPMAIKSLAKRLSIVDDFAKTLSLELCKSWNPFFLSNRVEWRRLKHSSRED